MVVPVSLDFFLRLGRAGTVSEALQGIEDWLTVQFGLALTESKHPLEFIQRAGSNSAKLVERRVMHDDESSQTVLLRCRLAPLSKIFTQFRINFGGNTLFSRSWPGLLCGWERRGLKAFLFLHVRRACRPSEFATARIARRA